MLKWMVGDDAFYQAIRNYSNQYAYNYATGMDFKSSFEASTGKDFTEFLMTGILVKDILFIISNGNKTQTSLFLLKCLRQEVQLLRLLF
jgi:hypothetical protein